MTHPTQPIHRAPEGTLYFRENEIVRFLLEASKARGCGLNELRGMGFSDVDWRQFAQLIGYTLDGYSELGFVSEEESERMVQLCKAGKPL